MEYSSGKQQGAKIMMPCFATCTEGEYWNSAPLVQGSLLRHLQGREN